MKDFIKFMGGFLMAISLLAAIGLITEYRGPFDIGCMEVANINEKIPLPLGKSQVCLLQRFWKEGKYVARINSNQLVVLSDGEIREVQKQWEKMKKQEEENKKSQKILEDFKKE